MADEKWNDDAVFEVFGFGGEGLGTDELYVVLFTGGGGQPVTISIGNATVTATGQAPTLETQIPVGQDTVQFAGQAPIVNVSAGTVIEPPHADLTMAGQAPSLEHIVPVTEAAVAATGQQPTQLLSISIGEDTLAATGQVPVVSFELEIAVPAATITITGQVPVLFGDVNIAIGAAALTAAGQVPTAVIAAPSIEIPAAQLQITGHVPAALPTADPDLDTGLVGQQWIEGPIVIDSSTGFWVRADDAVRDPVTGGLVAPESANLPQERRPRRPRSRRRAA